MSVRLKIFLCLLGVASFVWGLSAFLATRIFLEKFDNLDSEHVRQGVSRVKDAIVKDEETLATLAKLWSAIPGYGKSEQTAQDLLHAANLNLLTFVDVNGKVAPVYWRNTNYLNDKVLPPTDAAAIVKEITRSQSVGGPVSGILSTSFGPMLFAADALSKPEQIYGQSTTDPAMAGFFVGQLLDQSFESSLKSRLLADVQLLQPSDRILNIFRGNSDDIPISSATDDPTHMKLDGYSLLNDDAGQPALAIKVTETRQVYIAGDASVRFFLCITGVFGAVVVLFGTGLVELLVTGRIRKLTNSAKHADQSGMDDLPRRFIKGSDEISTLARVTKSMVERLRHLQSLYRAVIETQADLILRINATGEVNFANQAFSRFVGRHNNSVTGKNVSIYFTSKNSSHDFLDLAVNKAKSSGSRSEPIEMRYTNESGEEFWLEWSVKAIHANDGTLSELQAVGHDITLRRAYAKELEAARETAENADRAKAEFLAIMGHETRTPLTSILGFSAILEKTPLSEEQREYLSLIRASGNSLLTLLNDLNDYSTIAEVPFALKKTSVHIPSLIKEIIFTHSPAARAQDLDLDSELDLNVPEYIETDSTRLRQVLNNMVDNGIKFTTRGFVRLGVRLAGKGTVRFSVQDTGIGISEQGMQRLFKPFTTAHPQTMRGHGGSGIGLVVCQKLVRQMGSEISVRSQADLGSLFYFDIPVGEPEIPEHSQELAAPTEEAAERNMAQIASSQTEKGRTPRILVVDDNPINRKVACRMLKMIGFQADSAVGGRKCIEMASEGQYDMIFMDIQMPELDGFETSRLFRERESEASNGHHTYIVACTAFNLPGDRERCMAAGMDNYISKPLQIRPLEEVFMAYVKKESANRSATAEETPVANGTY